MVVSLVVVGCALGGWLLSDPPTQCGGPTIAVAPLPPFGMSTPAVVFGKNETIHYSRTKSESRVRFWITNTTTERMLFASTGVEALQNGTWTFCPTPQWQPCVALNPNKAGELIVPGWTNGPWKLRVVCTPKSKGSSFERVRVAWRDWKMNMRNKWNEDTTRVETFAGQPFQIVSEPALLQ